MVAAVSWPPAVVLRAVAALAALLAVHAAGGAAVTRHVHVRHVAAALEDAGVADVVQLLDRVHDLGVQGLGQRVPHLQSGIYLY